VVFARGYLDRTLPLSLKFCARERTRERKCHEREQKKEQGRTLLLVRKRLLHGLLVLLLRALQIVARFAQLIVCSNRTEPQQY
jgi:hypothetical protein